MVSKEVVDAHNRQTPSWRRYAELETMPMKRQAAAAKEALKVNESSETPHGSEALEAATEQKESTAAQKRHAPPAATDGDSTMEADGSDTPCSGNIKGEGSGSSEVARRIITRGISQQKTPAATQKAKGRKGRRTERKAN